MHSKDTKGVMDDVMVDLSVGQNIDHQTSVKHTQLKTEDGEFADESRTPTPPPRTLTQSALARRSRRNSVQTACERCRRRKIRCSGLPGPCASCARLNVQCLDPARRKDRAQSMLEDRIQRLEALALSNSPFNQGNPTQISLFQLNQPQPQPPPQPQPTVPIIAQPQPRHVVQFDDPSLAAGIGTYQFGQPSTVSPHQWDNFPIPGSPACFSDVGPDLIGLWNGTDYLQQPGETTPTPEPGLHKRSHTLPVINTETPWQFEYDDLPKSAGGFSDIPSIEITSHGSSRPASPAFYAEASPAGIAIPFRLTDHDDNYDEPAVESSQLASLSKLSRRTTDDAPVEYYGDLLSPLDQPPPLLPLSRRSSTASSDYTPSLSVHDPADRTASFVYSGSSRNRLNRAQTLPSSMDPDHEVSQYVAMTINSPRTRHYIQVYFQQIHPQYPFLDPLTFNTNRSMAYRSSGLESDSLHHRTTIPVAASSYQTLLVAAIGAMAHHQSRGPASRLVRHAMSLQPQIDLWGTVAGLHCAMLLAIYLFLESTMAFNDEGYDTEDFQKPHFSEPSHVPVNLWLHNCQVAAASIDLGMHMALSPEDEAGMTGGNRFAEMARSTFRVIYVLDKRISAKTRRPRALHDSDLDPALIGDLMAIS